MRTERGPGKFQRGPSRVRFHRSVVSLTGDQRTQPKYAVEASTRSTSMDSVSVMSSRYRAAQALAVAVLLGAGCKPAGPRVQIVSPARGAVVSGNVLVALRASPGLHVVAADGSRKAGEGHFHVLV